MENKVMAQGSKEVGRKVMVARDTDTPAVPGDYAEFMGSDTKQYVTYANRMETISDQLGNKDSVKG